MKKTTPKPLSFSKSHYGKWVALSKDKKKILSYSNNLLSLKKRMEKKDVVITKALDPDKEYAF